MHKQHYGRKLGFLTSIIMSPKLGAVVSGSWKKTIRVWDYQSGEIVNSII